MKNFLFLIASLLIGASSPALAAVVRTDDERALPFSSSYGSWGYSVAPLQVDLNRDGIDDLSIHGRTSSYSSSRSSSSRSVLTVTGLNGAQVTAGRPLQEGDLIDASLTFAAREDLAHYSYSRSRSRWGSSSSRRSYTGSWADSDAPVAGFLGVQTGTGHFGWAEFDISALGRGSLLSFGAETVAGRSLLAGQAADPAPLPTPLPAGLLLFGSGLGAAGLLRLRREKAVS